VDLIEVIRIQSSGPTEAARALRKKLWVVYASSISRANTFVGSMATYIAKFVRLSSWMHLSKTLAPGSRKRSPMNRFLNAFVYLLEMIRLIPRYDRRPTFYSDSGQ
jgi:hypothetical protein